MDGTVASILPVGSAVIPELPLASAPAALPVLWFLVGAGAAVGVSLLVVIARAAAPALEELVGRATAGTVAEPLGALVLDTVASIAALRWHLADVALSWHPAIDEPGARAPDAAADGRRPALARAA